MAPAPAGTSQGTSCGASRPRRPTSAACGWAAAASSVSIRPPDASGGGPRGGGCRAAWGRSQAPSAAGAREAAPTMRGLFPQRRGPPRRGGTLGLARLEPQRLGQWLSCPESVQIERRGWEARRKDGLPVLRPLGAVVRGRRASCAVQQGSPSACAWVPAAAPHRRLQAPGRGWEPVLPPDAPACCVPGAHGCARLGKAQGADVGSSSVRNIHQVSDLNGSSSYRVLSCLCLFLS